MKLKKIVSTIFCFCFLLPVITFVAGCNNKDNVEAPTILSVFQTVEGNVYVKHSALHNEYSPEFSIDGQTWCQTQFGEDNSCLILSYYDNSFHYRTRDSEDLTLINFNINIVIRECETKTTYASAASNTYAYQVLKPQTNLQLASSTSVTISSTQVNIPQPITTAYFYNTSTDNNYSYDSLTYIAYSTTDSQFSFATHSHKNIQQVDQTSTYTFDDVYEINNSFANNLEYCFINSALYTDPNFDNAINNAAFNGEITFTDCTTLFSIENAPKNQSKYGQFGQCATMVIRKKATPTTTLASRCSIIEIFEMNF